MSITIFSLLYFENNLRIKKFPIKDPTIEVNPINTALKTSKNPVIKYCKTVDKDATNKLRPVIAVIILPSRSRIIKQDVNNRDPLIPADITIPEKKLPIPSLSSFLVPNFNLLTLYLENKPDKIIQAEKIAIEIAEQLVKN